MLCSIKLKSSFSPCVPAFNSQVKPILKEDLFQLHFCVQENFLNFPLSVYVYICEHTYLCFSLKAAYKLSLSVSKIVVLLFSWNTPGWKLGPLFLLKNLVVYFAAFWLYNWEPHRLIQLITQGESECFANDGQILSFYSRKTLDSVAAYELHEMTGDKRGVLGLKTWIEDKLLFL